MKIRFHIAFLFALLIVRCEPFVFNVYGTAAPVRGRIRPLRQMRLQNWLPRMLTKSPTSTIPSATQESTVSKPCPDFDQFPRSLKHAASLMVLSWALTSAPQSAHAYFQPQCASGTHLNHVRGSLTSIVKSSQSEYASRGKGSFIPDHCPAFPAEGAETVSLASSLEGVFVPRAMLEDQLPTLAHKSVEDIGTLQNMGLAFVASALSTITMHPVDTIKTRMQRRRKQDHKGGTPAPESGSLYRGLLANVAREGPCNAMYLGVYEAAKRQLFRNPSTTALAQHWPVAAFLAAGAIGDLAGCVVSLPGEIVKRKVQSGTSAGYAEAVVEAVGSEAGRAASLASAGAMFVRDVPEGALQMALFEEWKLSALPALHAALPALDAMATDGLLGAAAGAVAAAATTPLDVALTRLSTQEREPQRGGGGGERMGVCECMAAIVREDGVQGLWRGVWHRVGYFAPLEGLMFAAYGWLQAMAVDEGRLGVLLRSLPTPGHTVLHGLPWHLF